MKYGYLKVASAVPKIEIADCNYNTSQIENFMAKAEGLGAEIIVFPELCVTGYSCQDLFQQQLLLEKAEASLLRLMEFSRNLKICLLYTSQEQGFFNVPVDHLYASTVMLPYVKSLNLPNLCIATPDVGGSKRAASYAKYLGCPMVMCNKSRKKANEVAEMQIIGDVTGMDVVLVDDIVDTAGTITKAADLIMSRGAKSVRAIASHCIMSGPADERVQASALEEMVFTDSIPYRGNRCV